MAGRATGSDRDSGQTIAVLSSITATCRRLGVDPFAYLKAVIATLTESPDMDLDLLLPDVLQLES
jgi:hypothetical protein